MPPLLGRKGRYRCSGRQQHEIYHKTTHRTTHYSFVHSVTQENITI